jgi:hypothetical protein
MCRYASWEIGNYCLVSAILSSNLDWQKTGGII